MIYVVSDLHGASDALKKAVPEGSTLLLLGDLVNLIDYLTMTGILIEVFSRDAVEQVLAMRAAGRFDEARRVMADRSKGREDEIRQQIGTRVREEYELVFAALPDPTYLILGNVDWPPMVESFAHTNPAVHLPDGGVVALEGERFGFVGGALPTPLHVAGEITEEQLRARWKGWGRSTCCVRTSRPQSQSCATTRWRGIASRGASTSCATSRTSNRAATTSGMSISRWCRRCGSGGRSA